MNLLIKPYVDHVGPSRREDKPLANCCEVNRNAPAHAACHLPPEFTVIFATGTDEIEMDLCYQHTIEITCTVCNTMGKEVRR